MLQVCILEVSAAHISCPNAHKIWLVLSGSSFQKGASLYPMAIGI